MSSQNDIDKYVKLFFRIIRNIYIGISLLFLLVGVIYLSTGDDVGIVHIVISVILFAILLYVKYLGYKTEKKQKAERDAERKAREEFLDSVKNKTYEFPCEEFFVLIDKEGITKIENEFERKKSIIILESLLEKNDIPKSFSSVYENDLKELYNKGKGIVTKKEEEKKKAEEEKRKADIEKEKHPMKGKLPSSNSAYQETNRSLSMYTGKSKRKRMLEDMRKPIEKRYKELKEGQEAMRELGQMMQTSVAQKRTTDWAIAGGMASAIGGSVAGAIVASDIIKRNEEIQRWNEENRRNVNNTANSMYSSANNLNNSIADLSTRITKIDREIEDISNKVVLSDSTEKLLDSLDISASGVPEDDYTRVVINIENNYVPDVPDGTIIVVDGTFSVELTCKESGETIDVVPVALPLYGVRCGESIKVEAYTAMYMKNKSTEMNVKIVNQKFWAMEL